MNEYRWMTSWKSVLRTFEIRDGKVRPVSKAAVLKHKRETAIPLPNSYYGYCLTFGAGELSSWSYAIHIPSARSKYYGLDQYNEWLRNLELFWRRPEDAEQHQRAIYFAKDVCASSFFWDTQDLTDPEANEYGIYIRHREGMIYRLADTFWEFINDRCLRDGITGYDYSEGVERVFSPAI